MIAPDGVILPIDEFPEFQNQTLPSGPCVSDVGELTLPPTKFVAMPSGVIRVIELSRFATQRFPSPPVSIEIG